MPTADIYFGRVKREASLMNDLADKRVLITGGLGFIGSNLAIELVERGAKVTLLDAMIPGHGGNVFNIEPVKHAVVVNFSDIRDENSMNYMVRGQDYIFHLAGQNDHVLSQTQSLPRHRHQCQGVGRAAGGLPQVQPRGQAGVHRHTGRVRFRDPVTRE